MIAATRPARLVLLLIACLVVTIRPCEARIEFLEVVRDDRATVLITGFSYVPTGGVFQLNLHSFDVPPKDSTMYEQIFDYAFVLVHDGPDTGSEDDGPAMLDDGAQRPAHSSKRPRCFHHKHGLAGHIFRIDPSLSRWNTQTFQVNITAQGRWSLYFSNCEPETAVSYTLDLKAYNVDETGRVDYLSAGESTLPTWYMFFAFFFALELLAWVYDLKTHRPHVRTIHHIMTALIFLKLGSLVANSVRYQVIKTHGRSSMLVDGIFFSILFGKQTLLFTTIILIGAGWSYLKPTLATADKVCLSLILGLQVWVNAGQIVTHRFSHGDQQWAIWMFIVRLCDAVRCGVSLIPTLWSIHRLRTSRDTLGASVDSWMKLLKWYLVICIAYFYLTRIMSSQMFWLLSHMLSWYSSVTPFRSSLQLDAHGIMFQDLAALLFYCCLGFIHRPRAPRQVDSPYDFPGLLNSPPTSARQSPRNNNNNNNKMDSNHQSDSTASTAAIAATKTTTTTTITDSTSNKRKSSVLAPSGSSSYSYSSSSLSSTCSSSSSGDDGTAAMDDIIRMQHQRIKEQDHDIEQPPTLQVK